MICAWFFTTIFSKDLISFKFWPLLTVTNIITYYLMYTMKSNISVGDPTEQNKIILSYKFKCEKNRNSWQIPSHCLWCVRYYKKNNIAVAQNTKWIHTESTIGLPSAAEFYWFLNAKLRWIPQMNGFKIPIWETAQ